MAFSARFFLLTLALAACGGAPTAAPVPPAAGSSAPAAIATTEAPAPSAAPSATSGPAGGELIGQPIHDAPPAGGDAKKAEGDAQLAAVVLMKSGHKECLKVAREKKPDWKPVHYEVVLTLKADGHPLKVEADKAKTDVSDPAFMPCVLKKLQGGTYPAPGREVTARLIYPE